MASRNIRYHVNFNGGFTGINNPGGQTYYVGASGYAAAGDGIAPSNSNTGTSPQAPLSTIQAALDKCVSGRGDVVAVLPGSYTVSAAITMTKDDVRLVSAQPVGPREYGPVVIVDATAATSLLTINANNCTVDGIVFDDNVAAATADTGAIMINTASTGKLFSGTILRNCYIDMDGADTDRDGICVGLTADATDAAPKTTVEGCVVYNCEQDAIVVNVGSDGSVVRDCYIYDDGTRLCRYGVEVLAIECAVEGCDIMLSDTATPGACVHNGIAAARLLVTGSNLHAWGADTTCILVVNTATQRTANNWLTATAIGNTVDYLTDNTTNSADTNISALFEAAPTASEFDTPTVAGS